MTAELSTFVASHSGAIASRPWNPNCGPDQPHEARTLRPKVGRGALYGRSGRRPFGGWGIYRNVEMVAIVYEGRTYLNATTEAAQGRFIAAGMRPFRPRPEQTFKSFWEIPPEVLHDAGELATWNGQSQ